MAPVAVRGHARERGRGVDSGAMVADVSGPADGGGAVSCG